MVLSKKLIFLFGLCCPFLVTSTFFAMEPVIDSDSDSEGGLNIGQRVEGMSGLRHKRCYDRDGFAVEKAVCPRVAQQEDDVEALTRGFSLLGEEVAVLPKPKESMLYVSACIRQSFDNLFSDESLSVKDKEVRLQGVIHLYAPSLLTVPWGDYLTWLAKFPPALKNFIRISMNSFVRGRYIGLSGRLLQAELTRVSLGSTAESLVAGEILRTL